VASFNAACVNAFPHTDGGGGSGSGSGSGGSDDGGGASGGAGGDGGAGPVNACVLDQSNINQCVLQ